MQKTGGGAARSSAVYLQGLACGALLTFATPVALLLVVLMAPALACLLAEQGSRKGVSRAVALACAAAAVRPGWLLWSTGDQISTATDCMIDPAIVGLAWGAGAGAWALCQVLPVLLQGAWDIREAARAHAIEAELKGFREDWDLDT